MNKLIVLITAALLLHACRQKEDFDASGNFEADEVIVSAQQNGTLISYSVQEGAILKAGDKVGQLDVRAVELQKEQVEASIQALSQKTASTNDQSELVRRQLAVQETMRQVPAHAELRAHLASLPIRRPQRPLIARRSCQWREARGASSRREGRARPGRRARAPRGPRSDPRRLPRAAPVASRSSRREE